MKQKRRTKYLSVIFSGLAWIAVLFIFFEVDPEIIKDIPFKNSYLLFFLSLFTAMTASGMLVFKNARRVLFVTGGVTIFLYMRVWEISNILNSVLLTTFLIALEIAISNKTQ